MEQKMLQVNETVNYKHTETPFDGLPADQGAFSGVWRIVFTVRYFYSREQRAKRTCWHVHLAVLCAGGTRLAPTEVERRPAVRV